MDEQLIGFFAGFDLAAQRQEDGTLKPFGGGASISEFPEEVELFGNTYTLERVVKGNNGYESGIYV